MNENNKHNNDEPIATNRFHLFWSNSPDDNEIEDFDDDYYSDGIPLQELEHKALTNNTQKWFDFYGPGGYIAADRSQVDSGDEEIFKKIWKQTLSNLSSQNITKPTLHLFQFLKQEKIRIQTGYLNRNQLDQLKEFTPNVNANTTPNITEQKSNIPQIPTPNNTQKHQEHWTDFYKNPITSANHDLQEQDRAAFQTLWCDQFKKMRNGCERDKIIDD